MVLSGRDFIVRDAKTGEDLTRSILLQIILEAETAGMQMFSARALAQIIRFQGHAMQDVMGAYLEKNLQSFTDLQNQLAQQSTVLSPELWAQFLNGQAPALQGLMGNYLEQSKNMFSQLQEQMVKQAGSLFPVMPGMGLPKR